MKLVRRFTDVLCGISPPEKKRPLGGAIHVQEGAWKAHPQEPAPPRGRSSTPSIVAVEGDEDSIVLSG